MSDSERGASEILRGGSRSSREMERRQLSSIELLTYASSTYAAPSRSAADPPTGQASPSPSVMLLPGEGWRRRRRREETWLRRREVRWLLSRSSPVRAGGASESKMASNQDCSSSCAGAGVSSEGAGWAKASGSGVSGSLLFLFDAGAFEHLAQLRLVEALQPFQLVGEVERRQHRDLRHVVDGEPVGDGAHALVHEARDALDVLAVAARRTQAVGLVEDVDPDRPGVCAQNPCAPSPDVSPRGRTLWRRVAAL